MRIVKEPEVRKNEILDVAEKLFAAKGFETATVNDILFTVAIAKGTFYYYFKSKEDVLDAIVRRRIDLGIAAAKDIAANPVLSPEDKILMVMPAQQSQTPDEKNLRPVVHEPVNALFHQKIISGYVLGLGPILADIITEGIEKKRFLVPHPRETVEILLCAGLVIFDEAYFRWTKEEKSRRTSAFIYAMERLLGTEPKTLARMAKLLSGDSPQSGIADCSEFG